MRFIALCLMSFMFASGHAWALNTACSHEQCVGVIDAGSTGSRLHIYALHQNHDKTPRVEEIWSHKINPGFASLEPKSARIHAYLNELFENAPESIPVYFYATAGMRLLPEEQQAAYYAQVRSWFETSFWTLQEARTITGREEGIFAWLSVAERLRNVRGVTAPHYPSVMDMGGASVQVVIPVTSKNIEHAEDYIDVDFHDEKYTLFVHSFLGLGRSLVTSQFLNQPSCFPEGYPLPDGTSGAGDARDCSKHISRLIKKVHETHHVIHPVLHDNEVPRAWFVIGGLAYLAFEPPFNEPGEALTHERLLTEADRAVCHRPWASLKHEYPGQKDLSRACLSASYYQSLIAEGYGLSPEEPIHFLPGMPDNSAMDWTLGVVLQQH